MSLAREEKEKKEKKDELKIDCNDEENFESVNNISWWCFMQVN